MTHPALHLCIHRDELRVLATGCALSLAVCGGCTHAQATHARTAGEVMAIAGVVGIIGGVLATRATPRGHDLVLGFSLLSGAGIVTYAIGELEDSPAQRSNERPSASRMRS